MWLHFAIGEVVHNGDPPHSPSETLQYRHASSIALNDIRRVELASIAKSVVPRWEKECSRCQAVSLCCAPANEYISGVVTPSWLYA